MKKLILSLFGLISGFAAIAQCTPNPVYADSTFGVWPDTTTNFAPADLGQPYLQQLDLIVPASAADLGPSFPAIPLDSVEFLGITGLPAGLSYQCNSQTPAACTYLPEQLGCGVISGVPSESGIFELSLDVRGYTNLFGNVISEEHTFVGYRILVVEGLAVMETSRPQLAGVRNVPNPFASRTAFEFQLSKSGPVDLNVFNLLGEELWQQKITGKAGVNKITFESGDLQEGVYLYTIRSGEESFTGRMVINR